MVLYSFERSTICFFGDSGEFISQVATCLIVEVEFNYLAQLHLSALRPIRSRLGNPTTFDSSCDDLTACIIIQNSNLL